MTTASNNAFPSILITEGTAPASPASGKQRIYIDSTTHVLKYVNSSGTTSNVGSGATAPVAASYKRTSGDYTTSSATMVSVDGTNMALTVTTGAHRVLIGLVGAVYNSGTSGVSFDVDIDGTLQGNAVTGGIGGLTTNRNPTAARELNASFTYLSAALTAASHTFTLKWSTAGGTATLEGGSSGSSVCEFWVMEQGV